MQDFDNSNLFSLFWEVSRYLLRSLVFVPISIVLLYQFKNLCSSFVFSCQICCFFSWGWLSRRTIEISISFAMKLYLNWNLIIFFRFLRSWRYSLQNDKRRWCFAWRSLTLLLDYSSYIIIIVYLCVIVVR